ncbi:hypothetical protein NLI96_g4980 [Meripilus lineatus]|uniref:SPX domain-containing protein n=1 Tax=Meripilus lineatus TaxID=2056292 RepID=A0AAD5YJK5_9APHY|nr:hypothetical protein NLI96_g4980 [Physisporinus lineatus]
MKFSSSLKFNAVSEWWDEYIAYDMLKKHVYQLERQQLSMRDTGHDLEANEHTSLMGNHHDITSMDSQFIPLLDRELKKITLFYESQEKELMDDVVELQRLIQQQEDLPLDGRHRYMTSEDGDDDDDDDEEDEFDVQSPTLSRTTHSRSPVRNRRRRSRSESGGVANSGNARRQQQLPNRRYSMSSNEEHGDLEASLMSVTSAAAAAAEQHRDLTQSQQLGVPFSHTRSQSTASRSPINAARSLANRIFAMDGNNAVNVMPATPSAASNGSGSGQYQVQFPTAAQDTIWTLKSNYAWDVQLLFKRRITNLYLTATSLRSYVELNYSGFRKILKKYDKVTESELKDKYLHEIVEATYPFSLPNKDRLNSTINNLVDLYAKCVTLGDISTAKRQLRVHQREHIAWERDTVWRQMIGNARRGDPDGGMMNTLGGSLILTDSDREKAVDVPTPAGRIKLKLKHLYLLISILIFVVLLNVNVIKSESEGESAEEANRCFAILVFATVLWATEAIPLFVTSMMIPLLLVCLRVIRSQDEEKVRLDTPEATSFAGTKPRTVLLAVMGVACFASMWISNVAAPTLCFTLIRPILRTLPPKSKMGPCLIIGIALAANIGGQSSPISSPQNLIALQEMDPPLDWGKWFIVALPVSAISVVLIWLLLLVSYKPARSPDGEGEIEIKGIRATKDRFTLKQYWVSFVTLVTIGLWIVEHKIENVVGDMGVIAILPIVAFFSTGVLKKDDFEQFLWTVVFLAMGGISLGKGVTSSGLRDVMDHVIRNLISDLSFYTVVLVLSVIVLIVSTFISHTIASLLLVPIAKEVGSKMPGNHQNLLMFLTALICSAGMGMPVSGFPNQTAATQEDDMGQLYLSNVDFLKNGVPASIIATMVVATVGYLLMLAIGL